MSAPQQLPRRVLLWQALFTLGASALLSWSVPFLLLLTSPLRHHVSAALASMTLIGGAVALIASGIGLVRFRKVIRALEGPEAEFPPTELNALVAAPGLMTRAWVVPHCLALLPFATPLRPGLMDWTTGITVALLASLMLATASFPMHVLIRHDFLRVIELAPPKAMQQLIGQSERTKRARGRINRRMVAAVTMPIVFASVGCALIVNAHIRRDDERSRAEAARVAARSSLELSPGKLKGLEEALRRSKHFGFDAKVLSPSVPFNVDLEPGGVVELTTPLDVGSARVRFSASTVDVLSPASVIVSLLAAVAAAVLGFLLGSLLSRDLFYATRGVRLLGTNPGLGATGGAVIQRSRLRLVAELYGAIERLAERFAVFAQAQEDAIEARAAATRMRGLFFASVSHDLKSPLNSILGFTQLVFDQPLTKGQRESLQAIDSRAQELLSLIETILDAARVEEGHLSLVSDEVQFPELLADALSKANQLSGDFELNVFEEVEHGIPPLLVDRTRVVRALASLVAYSVRTNRGGKMWVRAEREGEAEVRIDIDVPNPEHTPQRLEAMMAPTTSRRSREHRGLALGLRLARSVVELHRGKVSVVDRAKKGAMFCVHLPTIATPLPTASAPLHSIPPPPPGWDDEKPG